MLIIALEWSGLQSPGRAASCALCPKRWHLPKDGPIYLREGTDLMPLAEWQT